MKYLKNRNKFVDNKSYKDILLRSAVKALNEENKNITMDNVFTEYSNELRALLDSIELDGYKQDALKSLLEDIDWSNTNIYKRELGSAPTVKEPIIQDAIMIISNNPKAIRFNNYEEYKEFAGKQKYFQLTHGECFYSIENQNYFHKNGSQHLDQDEVLSDIATLSGKEIVQVWDNKNQIGYVVPGTY